MNNLEGLSKSWSIELNIKKLDNPDFKESIQLLRINDTFSNINENKTNEILVSLNKIISEDENIIWRNLDFLKTLNNLKTV